VKQKLLKITSSIALIFFAYNNCQQSGYTTEQIDEVIRIVQPRLTQTGNPRPQTVFTKKVCGMLKECEFDVPDNCEKDLSLHEGFYAAFGINVPEAYNFVQLLDLYNRSLVSVNTRMIQNCGYHFTDDLSCEDYGKVYTQVGNYDEIYQLVPTDPEHPCHKSYWYRPPYVPMDPSSR